ncbi:hypothetical protein IC582_027090 [Cucumis melo]
MKVDKITPLVDAISLLSQVFDEADVKFAPTVLSITASKPPSISFTITLHIREQCFTEYSIFHQYRSWRISLHYLHQAMYAGRNSSRMTIRLPPISSTDWSPMILTFFSSRYLQPLVSRVNLSPPEETDLELINFVEYFSISSEVLERIIVYLCLLNDASVFVTLTSSQVRFVATLEHEIILNKEDGECEIVGFKGEFQIDFKLRLFPMGFILNLTKDIPKIFFSITDSHAVMTVPAFRPFGQYMLYFPHIQQLGCVNFDTNM